MKLLDAVLARPVATIESSGTLSPPAPFKALEQRAIEVASLFNASSIALKLLDDDPRLGTAVERMVDGGHLGEARRLLSHGMERRDSIWWAYLCAMEAIRHKDITAEQQIGFDLVLAWIMAPTDAKRKGCKNAIRSCGSTSMAGILCFAVWLSGGSISPYAKRHIEPNPHACGRLCSATVYLSSVYFDPGRWRSYLGHFIATGILVAKGDCPIPSQAKVPL